MGRDQIQRCQAHCVPCRSVIRIEQRRLGTRAYLLLLWQQDLDFDGMTDWLYPGDAFDTLDADRTVWLRPEAVPDLSEE